MSLDPNTVFQFSPMHRLQWEPAQEKHVILYPEGMVELSESAAEILKMCDGTRDVSEMVTALENQYETTGLMGDVAEFLAAALANGWINERPHH
jgi:pyrroloquinoline quinone biosynthesis protein D